MEKLLKWLKLTTPAINKLELFKELLNRHTGKEPYKCLDCRRRFRTRNTFSRHAMTKHYKVLTLSGSYAVSSKVLQTVTWDM